VLGQVGISIGASLFCGAGGLTLNPLAGVFAGAACGALATIANSQLDGWLNTAAQNDEYAEISVRLGVGVGGGIHPTHDFIPAVPCN